MVPKAWMSAKALEEIKAAAMVGSATREAMREKRAMVLLAARPVAKVLPFARAAS
jgi:hypothetical protein